MRLTLFLCIAVAGCRSSSRADAAISPATPSPDWLEGRVVNEQSTPTDGGTFVVRMMNEPATLNYLDDSSFEASTFRLMARNVLDSLIELRPDGSLAPGLASSWAESTDHRTVTLHLRPATWSNGKPFSSADVIATLTACADTKRPTASIRGEYGGITSWKAPDAATVEVTWERPSAFALRSLTRLLIFSREQLEGDWNEIGKHPIGTGPWVVASWERGQRLVLERRADASAGHVQSIVFRFVKDHTAANALFEKGEFDLMTNITPAFWRAMEKDEPSTAWAKRDWNRLRSVDNSFSYIAWNEARPVFADGRVRTALGLLYDRRLVTKVVDLDLEVPTWCPYYQSSNSCPTDARSDRFDPALAKAMLADAGFVDTDGDGVREREGVKLAFGFLLPANSVRLGKLVPLLQEQFRSAGVAMDLERVETTTLSARMNARNFEVVSRVWTEFDTEQDLFQLFHSSQIDGGANAMGYVDRETDRLIEAIRAEFDSTRRHQLEQQLARRLDEQQPMLFMTKRQALDAARKRVHGLEPSLAWYDLRRVWVSD